MADQESKTPQVIGDRDATAWEPRDKQWVKYQWDLLMFKTQRVHFDQQPHNYDHDVYPSLGILHFDKGGQYDIPRREFIRIILGGRDCHEIEISRSRARHLAEILLHYAETGDLVDARSQMP